MTAEIAIMNRSAIAVAADSAVTRGPNKVHVNANKIFRLSDRSPVGLMVYGNADVFGLPWELVAKLYRAELGLKTFGTIVEWSNSFLKFLNDDRFLDQDLANREIVTIAYYLAAKIHDNCSSKLKRILTKEVLAKIDWWIDAIAAAGTLDGYDLPTSGSFSRLYASTCKEVFADFFQKDVADHVLKKFPPLVRAFTGSKLLSDYMSGFVIFGYGDDEIFPNIIPHFVDCAPYGKPRIIKNKGDSITRSLGSASFIFSFAQSETASLFMEEVSGKMKRFFMRGVYQALEGFGADIFDEFEKVGKIAADEKRVYSHLFKKRVEEFTENFQVELDHYIHESSVSTILNALDGLGKEDMANLAEALVELTALKLKVSRRTEVVGGPIDIALLSKVDGFIWIKRKHYFDPIYNPHFFNNYPAHKSQTLGANDGNC